MAASNLNSPRLLSRAAGCRTKNINIVLFVLLAVPCFNIFNSHRSISSFMQKILENDVFSPNKSGSNNSNSLENQTTLSKALEQQPGWLFDPVVVPLMCPRNSTRRRRIIDVTWINSELSSLELRLNELWSVVDVFFISESSVSWKAEPFKNQSDTTKPLYLTDHMKDFERFKSKIVVNVVPPEISANTKYTGPYAIEMAQRDAVNEALKEMVNPQPTDLLIHADLDEIPRPGVIEKLACDSPDELPKTPICLHTRDTFYYYNYKCHIKFEWTLRPRLMHMNEGGDCRTTITNASIHCSSCFGSVEYVRRKILSNADPMEDSPLQLDTASILDRIRHCKDVYLRTKLNKDMDLRSSVDYGSIPLIVSKHPERWPHLLGEGPLYENDQKDITNNDANKKAVEGATDNSIEAVASDAHLEENEFMCLGITPILPRQQNLDPKYIIFYPRAGMGNVLMGYISAVMYACLTGRIVKIAPYEECEKDVFDCAEYFDPDAPQSICKDLEMNDELKNRYKLSNVVVKGPEAWDPVHCMNNKQHIEYFLCDDGLSKDEFIAVSSCQYWGDFLFRNPNFKGNLPSSSFQNALRLRLSPSMKVKEKMVQDGPYEVCIHVRFDLARTAKDLGDNEWVDHLGSCVRQILSRNDKIIGAKSEVLLFTMHQDVRDAIKQNLVNDNNGKHEVIFASEVSPVGNGGHSSDKHAGIADMFSMGKQCVHLLPSLKRSTYFTIAANLMANVSLFPGEQWIDGCLEESKVTQVNPISDYWNDGDVCKLEENTCQVKLKAHWKDTPNELSRIAYLVTVNATSPRTLRSTNILKSVGFDVRLELAPPVDDKVISNKFAQLSIYRQIALAPEGTGGVDGWGYIFEDDIILVGKTIENFDDKVDFSVAETLLEIEENETLFIYLGICGPQPQHVVSGPSRYCGKCAHAYGVSRKGAMALLEYEESRQSERYMDVLMMQWCRDMGGFRVVNAKKQSNQAADHFGTFIQDRRTFPTLIG